MNNDVWAKAAMQIRRVVSAEMPIIWLLRRDEPQAVQRVVNQIRDQIYE
jgi:hypothetical protein